LIKWNSHFTYEEGKLLRDGKESGSIDKTTGYRRLSFNRKFYYAHRIIWEMYFGEIPIGKQIDHRNRVRSDNLLSNLRVVTQSQNMFNTKDRPSKYGRGIKLTASGKFGARLGNKWIGSYNTLEEAKQARAEHESPIGK
jgi:hypothetical protein